jgi:amino acid adenylation domain-containing protein
VHEDIEFEVDYPNLAAKAVARHPKTKDREEIMKNFIRSFDLSKAPLLRVGLFRVEKHRHVLMLDMHHIITDGSSQAILSKEFMELYAGKELKPLRIQYKDYARWQKDQKEKLEKQEEYWSNVLKAEVPVLNLPCDYPRSAVQNFEGSTSQFAVDSEDTERLRELAANHGATLYMVLLAIFNILLAKLSGQEDILVGTPIAGRKHAEIEYIIGMFVNTLTLRNLPSPQKTVDDFLKEVKNQTLAAFENQEYQFEDLVEQVAVNRDVGRNPLFDVVFVLQNIDNPGVEIPGLKLRPYEYEMNISKFDLTLTGFEAEESLLFSWEYCTKLFKKETIERFSGYFKKVLWDIVKGPGKQLAGIEIISEFEKNRILYDFNNTEAEYPGDKTIYGLFEEQVERTPDGAALVGNWQLAVGKKEIVGDHISITYKELNEKADRSAHYLRSKGAGPETIMGIIGERSIETIIGILGILKAGGAYFPIDPEYPEERIDYMLTDSEAKVLVTASTLAKEVEKLRSWEVEKVFLKEVLETPETSSQPLNLSTSQLLSSSNLAYIIYTSGSTGRPKGVMVEQPNVIRLVKNTDYIQFREGGRLLQTGALDFDASTFEIWGSLLNGLTLYLAPKEEVLAAERLKAALRKYDIGTIWLTSPLFNQLSSIDVEIFAGLRDLLVGGDVLSPVHINRVRTRFPGLNIINGYGPTENTTFSTTFLITGDYREHIPIGKPIANSTAYIIDPRNKLVPVGVVGELCVGGDGMARGYLNNPELTAEKFFNLTLNTKHLTLYRTGDLARWLPDGNIEFTGRIDLQVKIRGFRIEPGEIENRLREIEEITEAVVIPREVEKGEKHLCAYIVTGERLSTCLPDYMIPSFFMKIEKIPLTPNGKVDQRHLPIPGIVPGSDYVGPRDEVEKKLVDIWANVLTAKKEKIGIAANFFELGGHSLKAVVMSSRIHKEFNVKLPLAEIFKTPTIKGLSEYIRRTGEEQFVSIEPVEEKDFHPLSPAQKRLYILQHMQRNNLSYNIPGVVLLEGKFEKGKLEEVIGRLIHRHENFRTSFEMMGQQPIQRIHHNVDFAVEYDERSEEEAKPLIDTFVRPFDLAKVPLLRIRLIKIGETRHLLMFDMHHIISDGTSMGIFVREFTALYGGKELTPLQIQYKDFSQWQNTRKRIETIKKQEEYWLGEFEGDVPVLNLPIDYERPAVQTSEGNSIAFEIGVQETMLLKETALEEGVTLYMVLLAIFNLLLSKECDQEDIIIGAPTAGRRHANLEPLIGFFINMLALRNFPTGRKTFREFLLEVKKRTLEAYENQDYQFEELVDNVLKDRESSRNSLIDVLFVFQNLVIMAGQIPEVAITELTLKPYKQDIDVSPFDLLLHGYEAGEKLGLSFQYRTKLFKEETMRMLIRNFKEVVSTVINNKNIRLQDIKISHDLLALESVSLQEDEGDFGF